jgi:hypothetical protein
MLVCPGIIVCFAHRRRNSSANQCSWNKGKLEFQLPQNKKNYLMRLTIYVDWEPDAGMAWPQLSMSLTPNVSMTGFTICLSFYIWTLEYRYTDRFTR